jgi:branched-subunit amino acid aminotransferase/4-amino-4-deoxychorismate lyase
MDLLYHDGDRVFEAASASVYFVVDGTILAPSADVLWGTVGSLVLRRASESGIAVESRDITLAEALAADEAFLTSTTRGVVPIVRLDDAPVGSGEPGPVTRRLMAMWDAELEQAAAAR